MVEMDSTSLNYDGRVESREQSCPEKAGDESQGSVKGEAVLDLPCCFANHISDSWWNEDKASALCPRETPQT